MIRARTILGWFGFFGYILMVVIASREPQFTASFMVSVLGNHFPWLTLEQKYFTVTLVRKLIHLLAYGGLALCCFFASAGTRPLKRRPFLAAFVLSLLVAGLDEFLQFSQAGRTGSLLDVGIDSLGIIIALLLTNFVQGRVNRKQAEQDS
ncbi:MAG: VanZ family protein [Limnochordia bacterium]|jgi:VanZ family protein|nr:VanZ family protein [Limnochordia bacterium]MDD4517503.1 VanZ family protein [Limnochordia bacterium]